MSINVRYWLRWAAVLPSGLLAAFFVMFPLHWGILLIYAVGGSPDGMVTQIDEVTGEVRGCAFMGLTCWMSPETMERLGTAFTTPFFFIFAGAAVAPHQRKIAGVVLAILGALWLGGFYVLAFTANAEVGLDGWRSLHWGATPVLNLLGVSMALITVWMKWEAEED